MLWKTYLKSLHDISNWNTSNLKYEEGMLYGFESDIIYFLNISNIVDFYFIYYSYVIIPLKSLFIEYYIKNLLLKKNNRFKFRY